MLRISPVSIECGDIIEEGRWKGLTRDSTRLQTAAWRRCPPLSKKFLRYIPRIRLHPRVLSYWVSNFSDFRKWRRR